MPNGWRAARLAAAGLLAAAAAGLAPAAGAIAAPAAGAGGAAGPGYVRACDAAPAPRQAACLVLVRTNVAQRSQASLGDGQPPTGDGYGPLSLQNAYLLPSGSAGSGQTVAIVDAFDDPTAASDLATYRADWGLPPCTTASGCFQKLNEDGRASPLPGPDSSWAVEESLDLDMVSAVCPNCHILLVEANSANVSDLGAAVNSAVAAGAKFVSNSYGATEYQGEVSDDASFYNHPGVVVTASAGDSGYGVEFPAASPNVVAVGGTTLKPAGNARGWAETVWNGTGSGCSVYEPKPGWQHDTGCSHRTSTDVSAVANPDTGVAIYDTDAEGGWLQVGGTSVASPIIASIYALVGAPAAGSYPASYLYAHAGDLNDVTSGSNGTCGPAYLCAARRGYDGPTGLGTPHGVGAFGKPTGNLVTVVNPGDRAATQDVPFRLVLHALDTAAGQTLTYAAAGLPVGLSIDPVTGVVSGTPTSPRAATVNVTATDSTGARGSTTFRINVADAVTFSGPGAQAGYLGQPVWLAVKARDAVAGRRLTYSATGLAVGLSINHATGVIAGLPTTTGYHQVIVTARDNAGRKATDQIVWYLDAAQAVGRAGLVRLGHTRLCLARDGTASPGPIRLWPCQHVRGQSWQMRPDGSVRVQGQCLTVAGGRTAAGTPVQVAACAQRASQQWRISTGGELVNPAAGKCLQAASISKGAHAQLGICTGDGRQRWAAPSGPLVSAVTGQCADTGHGTTGHLQVWNCGNTTAQAWTIETDGTIRDGASCLTIHHVGATVGLGKCTASAAQKWRISPDGTLTNPATGKCLNNPGASSGPGTPLIATRCQVTTVQIWHIE